ncbi:hypothetical protein ACP4OV_024355 [Aristida adscensionis]
MDGGERTFKANFTAEGVALLRDRVKDKLRELMGDYSDDTLAEYVVVLLRNGRRKDEAAKELQVFLGDDNDAFVSWLWDHLSSNLHLYVQPKAVSTNDEATKSPRSTARGLPAQGLSSSIKATTEDEPEHKTSRTHQKREWGGIVRDQSEALTLRSVVGNVSHAEEKAFGKFHEEGKCSHRSHSVRRARSPDNHRKRSRDDDDARSNKKASNQAIGAPRRLLQFAVRDAVRTMQPVNSRSESAPKRLRSVVSSLASDSALDVTHVRLQKMNSDVRVSGATAALRAAAEAAEDVLKDRYSGSVFNRLGGMSTLHATEESLGFGEQDPEDIGYENVDNVRAVNKVEFHARNQYGDEDAYMYDRETEQATGSTPDIDEYDNTNVVRHNGGLGSRPSSLPASGGRESLVVGYVRGCAEVRNRKLIAQATHAGSGPRPSEKILNVSANSTPKLPNYETRNTVPFEPQVPMEKKSADARKSNVTTAYAKNTQMIDKSEGLTHSSSMVEAQKPSPLAAGSNSTGQSEVGADSRTIFISNVHFGATKDALSRHFNKFGAILKTLIVTDGVTGQPTGSAYIEFMHKESAEHALTLNGTSFMSRVLKVIRKSSTEVTQLPAWPRASRGSPFASRLIRTAYPRPTFPGAIRGRLPFRGGARSSQWKRDAADPSDAGKPSQITHATPGNQLVSPTTRSFTYTRTEPKPNDGAMV